jgi:hypothetical protein
MQALDDRSTINRVKLGRKVWVASEVVIVIADHP